MKIIAAPFCIFLLASSSAFAQTQAPSPAQPSTNSQACTPTQKGAPLGDKLADSKGVICPPPTNDSDVNVPPPDSGAKMPVIKPPANAK